MKITNKNYHNFLEDLKNKVALSRHQAVLSVNRELILLYHLIGAKIIENQQSYGWGAKIIDQLSWDLKNAFPDMKGFSPRNLKYMRKFAEEYPDSQFVQQVAAQIPWFHIVTVMDKVSNRQDRIFYMKNVIENNWSRSTMINQIENKLHQRQGQAITNFKDKLPFVQSDLAHYTLKDPYIFDFLATSNKANEREMEKYLIHHVEKFLLELGAGFAFIGSQYHLEVGDQDFYIDLLFYHLKLHCYVVVELKDQDFKPEYAGKMNFYLSAVDDLVKTDHDNPSIGIILCKSKNNSLAKYALRDMSKPIGLTQYKLRKALPQAIKNDLPTIKQLETELAKDFNQLTSNSKPPLKTSIRKASKEDIKAMVVLSEIKRNSYQKAQPQFWRKAKNANQIQAKWFEKLLNDKNYILLVAEFTNSKSTKKQLAGFIIGNLIKAPEVYNPGLTLMIDDFCIENNYSWDSIGNNLLLHLKNLAQKKEVTQILAVCGHHDKEKCQFLEAAGLSMASNWYTGSISSLKQ